MKKILFLIFTLLLFGCNDKDQTETQNDSNKIVSNEEKKEEGKSKQNSILDASDQSKIFTDKLIKNFYLDLEDNELIIEFYNNQEKIDFNKSNLLTFEPNKVEGKYRWKDDRTLVYNFLKADKNIGYKVEFSLKEYLKKDYKNLSFYLNFDTPKMTNLEISKWEKGDEHFLRIYPTFDKKVSKDFINSNLKLSLPKGDKLKNLQIASIKTSNNEGTKFSIVTSYFKKDTERQCVRAEFLGQQLERYFSYNGVMGIRSFEFREKNEKFTLYIKMGSYVENIDLKPYINIEGLDNFYAKRIDKYSIVINGNFVSGKDYVVKLFKDMSTMKKDEIFKVTVPSLQPKVEFKNEGIYLADSDNKKLRIRTRNLKGIKLSVKKVDKQNIDYFVDYYGIESGTSGKSKYGDYSVIRFGTELYSEKIKFDTVLNKWVERDIDLSVLGEKYGKEGIYLVEAAYDSDDILVPIKGFEKEEENKDAYHNYSFADYISTNAYVSKTVVLSNIGIITKKTNDRLFVYTSNLLDGSPVANAKITMFTNKGIQKSYSNEEGVAIFNVEDRYWNFVFGEKDGELSFVNKYNNYIDYSMADNSGTNKKAGLNAYIYTERGVYRPGDNVYISSILFEDDKEIPENMPLKLKIYSPLNKLYKEIEGENKGNCLYTFDFKTDYSDTTGNWRAELYSGEMLIGSKYIKIETIVPPVIKVKNKLEFEGPKKLALEIKSDYLFGAPGKNLEYNSKLEIKLANNPFTSYKNYSFVNETLDTSNYNNQNRSGTLNEEGLGNEIFDIKLYSAPFKLDLIISTEVFQKDGRKVKESDSIVLDFYDRYAGIERYDAYGEIGEKISLGTILLDKDGNPLNEELEYNVYKNDNYWWWDYSSFDSYKKHYKQSYSTILIENGKIKSGEKVSFTLEDYGNYYVEIIDSKGHRGGTFVKSGYYSYGTNASDNFMNLGLNKTEFEEGDKIDVSFESDTDAYGIINIEKNNEIISSTRIKCKKGINTYSVDAEKAFFPGVYINVIVLQNLKDKLSDSNIKLQGLKYIKIKDKTKEIKSSINAEKVYKDSKNISVKVKTSMPNSSFTLAAVDQGLLYITKYQNPSAYDYFYGKERYGILNYDNYKHIININKDKAYETLTPGGGDYRLMSAAELEAQKSDKGVNEPKRFKAISYFKSGTTDENGEATVNFEMDEYMGELRFMLVTTKDGAFGNDSQKAKVRGEIVMFPGLPRKLAPEDEISSNLNLFINDIVGKKGTVGIKIKGPIVVEGPKEFEINELKTGELNFEFKLKALNQIGNAKVTYYFKSENFEKEVSVDIKVDSQAPFTTYQEAEELEKDAEVLFSINNEAVKNSSEAHVRISRYPTYNLYGRLQYLIRYPYGCLEQTVSSIFPQLYIDKFLNLSQSEWKEVNKNINDGIKRLEKFQLPDGSLSYWKNEQSADFWSTNYAHYFLVEAIRNGYYVPDYLIDGVSSFQSKQANNTREVSLVNLYRLYILALNGRENISAMNYYRQNSMSKMNNTEKFLLAGAYSLIGYKSTAENIIKDISFEIKDSYWEDNFGSDLRDKAIILDVISRLKKDEKSNELNNEILEKLAGREWYSTQTLAYSLIAVSNYREKIEFDNDLEFSYSVDGKEYKEKLSGANKTIDLTKYFGKEIKIKNLSDKKLYTNYIFQGQMSLKEQGAYAKELRLKTFIYDEEGKRVYNLNNIKKGQSLWYIYKVEKQKNKRYKNIALAQNLGSGFEIENLRINNGNYPEWVYDIIGSEAYSRNVDIRDDRMIWFFDMYYGSSSYFVAKYNAVTPGTFFMPGATVEAMYSNEIGASLKGEELIIK